MKRIAARKEPTPITERMSPFMRKLAERRQSQDRFLAVTDQTGYIRGAFVPSGSGEGA
jgi:hypothetical protein